MLDLKILQDFDFIAARGIHTSQTHFVNKYKCFSILNTDNVTQAKFEIF